MEGNLGKFLDPSVSLGDVAGTLTQKGRASSQPRLQPCLGALLITCPTGKLPLP